MPVIYEDLAYNDKTENEGERIITDDLLASFLQVSYSSDQVRGGYLFDEEGFLGYILAIENTSSFGMSVNRSEGLGVLLKDGTAHGRTSYHYFHSSTEVSETQDSIFRIRKKG